MRGCGLAGVARPRAGGRYGAAAAAGAKHRPSSVLLSGAPRTVLGIKWMNSTMTSGSDDDKHVNSAVHTETRMSFLSVILLFLFLLRLEVRDRCRSFLVSALSRSSRASLPTGSRSNLHQRHCPPGLDHGVVTCDIVHTLCLVFCFLSER